MKKPAKNLTRGSRMALAAFNRLKAVAARAVLHERVAVDEADVRQLLSLAYPQLYPHA